MKHIKYKSVQFISLQKIVKLVILNNRTKFETQHLL